MTLRWEAADDLWPSTRKLDISHIQSSFRPRNCLLQSRIRINPPKESLYRPGKDLLIQSAEPPACRCCAVTTATLAALTVQQISRNCTLQKISWTSRSNGAANHGAGATPEWAGPQQPLTPPEWTTVTDEHKALPVDQLFIISVNVAVATITDLLY